MRTEEREERPSRREYVEEIPVPDVLQLPLTELVARLWMARRLILLGGIVGALLLAGTRLATPRTYTASALLLFPAAPASGLLADLGAGGNAAPSMNLMGGFLSIPQAGSTPQAAILVLKSHKASVEMVRRLHLELKPNETVEDAALKFSTLLQCEAGKTGDLTIRFTWRRPETARSAVAEAISTLQRSVEELSLDPATRNVAFLRRRLSEAEQAFVQAQTKLARFQSESNVLPADQQLKLLGDRYGALQNELAQAEIEANAQQTRVKAITNSAEQMLSVAQDPTGSNPLLAGLYEKSVEQQAKLTLLRQHYTDKHPDVIAARRELEQTRQSYQREVGRQLSHITEGRSPLVAEAVVATAVARNKLEGLHQASASLKDTLKRMPQLQMQQGRLMLDLESERARVITLRSELNKAQLVATKRGPQFVVVDPPTVPRKANGRKTVLFAVLGLVLGCSLMALRPLWQWMRRAPLQAYSPA